MLMHQQASKSKIRLLIEALEPRVLYSADAGSLLSTIPSSATAEVRMLETSAPLESTSAEIDTVTRELVFVDTRVSDYQTLVDDILNQQNTSKNIEVILLDAAHDGIQTILDTVRNQSTISAIHLIGEGNSAEMHLGGSFITQAAIENLYKDALTELGTHLSADADILIYGCNFGQGDTGLAAVEAISSLTGADVAASVNRTGHATEFGDWDLEIQYGQINTQVIVSAWGQQNWFGALATFTVTNLNDSGFGSLREAITNANFLAGADSIFFSIAGTGIHTINLSSILPDVTGQLTIDATTDDSYAANGNRPAIVLDGNNVVTDGFRLYTGSDGSVIKGFVIQGFTEDGVDLAYSDNHTVQGNWIGLNDLGTGPSNNSIGVNIWNSNNNLIGGTTAQLRNVISGNTSAGIFIGNDGVGTASNNQIVGNYIGTNASGNAAVANDRGIFVDGSSNTIIGSSAAGGRNIISGSHLANITLIGAGTTGSIVQNNYIGTDVTGMVDLNGGGIVSGQNGVSIFDGANNNLIGTNADGSNDSAERNVIAGNNWVGVDIVGVTTTNNWVQGNYIGTNATGMTAIAGGTAVSLWNSAYANHVGSGESGAGNVIAGMVYAANGAHDNLIQGNIIGLGADGATALGLSNIGVSFESGGFTLLVTGNIVGTNADGLNDGGERNVISGINYGVALNTTYVTGNTIAGNYIGTDVTGLLDRGNAFDGILIHNGAYSNVVGGALNSQHNVISGNTQNGISITDDTSDSNVIQGNWIGVNASGNGTLGNGYNGISVAFADNTQIGGALSGEGNWIVANTLNGVVLAQGADATSIRGNLIGTDLTGTLDWGNFENGVFVTGTNNVLVGGVTATAGNIVAFNGKGGVYTSGISVATDATNVSILGNSIYSNVSVGIDLGDDNGVDLNDLNDADIGANNYQNFPVLTSAASNGVNTYILGSLNSTSNTAFRIEFFANAAGTQDATGYGEGRRYLGYVDLPANPSNNHTFDVTLGGVTLVAGEYVTATATEKTGPSSYANTSEFSMNVVAVQSNQAPAGTNGAVNVTEDTDYIFTLADFGFTDADGDNFDRVYFTTLPVLGTLKWNGATISANDFVVAADISAGLLTYTPPANANGNSLTSFTFQVSDDGGVANGGVNTDQSPNSMMVNVAAVNDAPVNTVPAGIQTTALNTSLVFSAANGNAMSVVDIDAGVMQVTLTITQGNLTLASLANLSFSVGDGTADTSMTFSGSQVDINNALNGLSFSPNNNYQGSAVLSMQSSDLGGTGTGGTLTDSDAVNIQVGAARFQQGVAGYTGTDDTWVSGSSPNVDHGAQTTVIADDNNAGDAALLRFSNLFGAGVGQIPLGSTINSVTLSIFVTNRDAADLISLYRMFSSWTESSTYNTLTSGVQTNGTEAGSSALLTFSSGTDGWNNLSNAAITAAVQAWANGATNNGWAFVSNSADSWTFASSENADTSIRPYLTIDYTAPQASTLTATGGSASYTENAAAVAVDAGITIVDPDSTTLAGAVVRIVTNYANSQDTLNFTNQNGIVGSWDTNGILTLTGSATVSQYQTALRSITYVNSSDAPSTLTRTVEFVVNDGYANSNAVTRNVTVTAVNDAPTFAASGGLNSLSEDQVNNSGTLISQLIFMATLDADAGALKGIAVTGVDTTNGQWEYTLDGSNWFNVGALSATNALLLPSDATAAIRFVPNLNFNGNSGLVFYRAWDQTSGTAGNTADASVNGGSTAFSTQENGTSASVSPVNDAPVLTPYGPVYNTTEGAAPITVTVATVLGASVTDVDAGAVEGVAITGNLGGGGTISYSTDGGATWIDVGVVSETSALLLRASDLLRFTPGNDDGGVMTTSYRAWDQTTGSAGTKVNVSVNGGTTAFSAASDLVTTNVAAVNDAPTSTPVTLAPIAEDSGGRLITQAQLLANANDVDGPSLTATGLSISSGNGSLIDNGDGTWTYTPLLNDDTSATFSYTITDGSLSTTNTASLDITPMNDAPEMTGGVGFASIAEDTTQLTIQVDLLASFITDADSGDLRGIAIIAVDNSNGTWQYTLDGTSWLNVGNVSTTSALLLAEDGGGNSGFRFVPNADWNGTTGPIQYIAWDQTTGTNGQFADVSTSGGSSAYGTVVRSNTLTVYAVNDAPVLTPYAPVFNTAEGAAATTMTVASLLQSSVTDVDAGAQFGIALSALSGVSGTVMYSTDGGSTWLNVGAVSSTSALLLRASDSIRFTPDADNNGVVTMQYHAWDQTTGTAGSYNNVSTNGGVTAFSSATETVTFNVAATNDAPTSTPVTLAPIAEDSGGRLITQAQLLANASDVDGPSLTATGLSISSGNGSLVDNGDGTWTYTSLLNDDTSATFIYTITDGSLSTANTASLDITPVNDAPTSTPVTLAPIAEDSGGRLITQAQLLANASDVDGPSLTATGLSISSGNGSLVDNGDGTWTYTSLLNDDTSATFIYTITDGSLSTANTASLDITPVNDAPTSTPVTLAPIVEDGGGRLITQAQLLANASDVDGPSLTATGLSISSGNGSLVDNGDGTWTYTPLLNDDTSATFIYTITDGSLSTANTASLDITPVNDAPISTPVSLVAIVEDSGPRLITQSELLINANDVDGPSLTATGLSISSGNGSLVDNGDGTWTYTPALNDDTAVTFAYSITDSILSSAGTASMNISAVNDPPTNAPVTLVAIVEDNGSRLITQPELLSNATGPNLVAQNLAISAGSGTLVDNGDGTWTYTPNLDDDGAVVFSYDVSSTDVTTTIVAGSASLDITPVNDAPTSTPVTLAPIAEDSGGRLITQTQLLANANDVDGPSLTATGLSISSGNGSLVDNGDGTWTYTPLLNDDTSATFIYTITDGSLSLANTASLDITPVNDAPLNSADVILSSVLEDTPSTLITQAELLANASDIEVDSLVATTLVVSQGAGTLTDNADGTWTYTPLLNDDTDVVFSYGITDGTSTTLASVSLDMLPENDAPTSSAVMLAAMNEDGARLLTEAELLAGASDVDSATMTVSNLSLSAGAGTLINNNNGTWSFTPIINDDSSVSFVYTISDGSLSSSGFSTLDILPVDEVFIDPGTGGGGTGGGSTGGGSTGGGSTGGGSTGGGSTGGGSTGGGSTGGGSTGGGSTGGGSTGGGSTGGGSTGGGSTGGGSTGGGSTGGGSTGEVLFLDTNQSNSTQINTTNTVVKSFASLDKPIKGLSAAVKNNAAIFLNFKGLNVATEAFDTITTFNLSTNNGLNLGENTLINGLRDNADIAFDVQDLYPAESTTTFEYGFDTNIKVSGIVVSAGLVAWATQYTGLLASLFASLPAWTNLDPMPILSKREEDEAKKLVSDDEIDEDDDEVSNEEDVAANILGKHL